MFSGPRKGSFGFRGHIESGILGSFSMTDYSNLFQSALNAVGIALTYWWVYTPIVLYFILFELYESYTKKKYLSGLTWVLLEVTPPPQIFRSPKIAENFFAGLHGIYSSPVSFKEKFFEGKVQDWVSLEIVSNAGELRFFIRCPDSLRNVIETQLFAQYPDAEIKLADDYMTTLPEHLPNEEYDLFGAELIFTREQAYPIKTYAEFDEKGGRDEPERTDPLAPLAEIMSVIGPGEHIGLQLLARPTNDDWVKKEGQAIIDKIMGKTPKAAPGNFLSGIIDVIDSFIPGGAPAAEKKEEKKDLDANKLSPIQKKILEQVENKVGKLVYEGGHRFMYVAKKDVFNKSRISSVIGMFKQLYANNLNSFKPNPDNATKDKGWFHWFFPSDKGFGAEKAEFKKKKDLYGDYRKRKFVKKANILSVEEMATLYHLPNTTVGAPSLPRVEAKKGQPPSGLPTRDL
jgi:hypothetical protein